jgi:hypothetical protein
LSSTTQGVATFTEEQNVAVMAPISIYRIRMLAVEHNTICVVGRRAGVAQQHPKSWPFYRSAHPEVLGPHTPAFAKVGAVDFLTSSGGKLGQHLNNIRAVAPEVCTGVCVFVCVCGGETEREARMQARRYRD